MTNLAGSINWEVGGIRFSLQYMADLLECETDPCLFVPRLKRWGGIRGAGKSYGGAKLLERCLTLAPPCQKKLQIDVQH